MLVLKRTQGEQIIIAGGIEITMLGLERGSKVKLGFTAPSDVRIMRKELLDPDELERMMRENQP